MAADQSPTHPVEEPAHPVEEPAHPVEEPAHPVEEPARLPGRFATSARWLARQGLRVGARAGARVGALPGIAALWLGLTLWSAHETIIVAINEPAVAVSAAGLALPAVIAAILLAAATAGLTTTRLTADRPSGAGWIRSASGARAALGALAGGSVGMLCAALLRFGYGGQPAMTKLALAAVAAGLIGGAGAALTPSTLAAGLWATMAALTVGLMVSLVQSPLKRVLGAGSAVATQVHAARGLSYLSAGLAGVMAGLVAYAYLRRRAPQPAWPQYLLAGSFAGLLYLVAEILTRVGGATVRAAVRALTPADRLLLSYLDSARVVNALVLGFAGGIVAMIAIGRTMQPRADEPLDDG